MIGENKNKCNNNVSSYSLSKNLKRAKVTL